MLDQDQPGQGLDARSRTPRWQHHRLIVPATPSRLVTAVAQNLHPTGSTKQDPRHTPAPDLVNRNFTAGAPNRLWVADATRIPCGEGVFWLAALRDVFSRRIVGWKTSDRCDTDLILAALEYGIWSRDVRDGQLIHHSDRGSNYTPASASRNAYRTTESDPRWGPSATRTTTP
jgi:transposase InsO family protein